MLWVVWLAACTDGGEGKDTSGHDTEPGPSAQFELAENPGCETFDDGGTEYAIPGATSFFIGELAFSGEDVTGYEARVMFANDAWVEAVPDASDCRVTWQIVGVVQEPGCAMCDYSLALHASLDRTESDCVDDFVDNEEPEMDFVYDVALTEDGGATVFFESGTTFASLGGGDDAGLWYQSDSQCLWF